MYQVSSKARLCQTVYLAIRTKLASWRYSSLHCALQGWPLHWWLVKRAHPSLTAAPASARQSERGCCKCWPELGPRQAPAFVCDLYRNIQTTDKHMTVQAALKKQENITKYNQYDPVKIFWRHILMPVAYLWRESGVIQTSDRHVECGGLRHRQPDTRLRQETGQGFVRLTSEFSHCMIH